MVAASKPVLEDSDRESVDTNPEQPESTAAGSGKSTRESEKPSAPSLQTSNKDEWNSFFGNWIAVSIAHADEQRSKRETTGSTSSGGTTGAASSSDNQDAAAGPPEHWADRQATFRKARRDELGLEPKRKFGRGHTVYKGPHNGRSDDQPKPASLKSRLEAFQSSTTSSSSPSDTQRSRVPSGSLKDRIAMFNANADTSKPLIPTSSFGQSAPPPGAPARTTGGGLIGNRIPKLDPSGAGVLGRNVAQPVPGVRKVSENRGLVGNRIPSVSRHHTGGSTGSAAGAGDQGEMKAEQKSVPLPQEKGLPTSADLEENAVDLESNNVRDAVTRQPEGQASSNSESQKSNDPTATPQIPEIRAEDLVPSTLPRDNEDSEDISSDISEPPSPRSTSVQASGTPQSMSSVPPLERITSRLSLADSNAGSTMSGAGSQVTHSSLRVETGDDDSSAGDKADGSLEEDEARRNISEEQDNLSDVSTPTGTPTMPQREYLPEIPGMQSHPIGGLSLHPDGTVSPAAFGTGRKGAIGLQHLDEVMVDTSALPDETQKLKHEGQIAETNPDATETEKNRKGNEPTSQGDFEMEEDKMVHIELPEDDPALTEEGRELQRKARENLHAEAERKGKTEWEVMEDNSDDKPETVKEEQRSANEQETGDPTTSFMDVHEQKKQEAYAKDGPGEKEKPQQDSKPEEKAQDQQEDTDKPSVQMKDFGAAASSTTERNTAKIPSGRDVGKEPESPLSNEDREHLPGSTGNQEIFESEPPTTRSPDALDAESQRSLDKTLSAAPEDQEPVRLNENDKGQVDDAKKSNTEDDVKIQDIEDIPTGDDTELHKKDQDPNVDSLIVGKSDTDTGVEPELQITEEGTEAADVLKHGKSKQLDVEPAPYVAPRDKEAEPQSPGSVASVPSEIEEPDDSPLASNSNIALATFPSVPKQEPLVTEITEKSESNEISRAATPGSEEVNMPSVPKDNVDSPESKVRVGVTLSPGKHLGSGHQDQVGDVSKESLEEDVKRFLAKKDGSGVEPGQGKQSEDVAPSLDALAATISEPAGASRLAKSTSSSSTLSSSSTSSKKKKTQDRGRSPLLDMDVDGEDGGETGWAKVSVNKTKYS